MVDGKRICFFRLDGFLRIRTLDQSFTIVPEVTSSWKLMARRALFQLAHASTTILEVEYTAFQWRDPISSDITPFAQEKTLIFSSSSIECFRILNAG